MTRLFNEELVFAVLMDDARDGPPAVESRSTSADLEQVLQPRRLGEADQGGDGVSRRSGIEKAAGQSRSARPVQPPHHFLLEIANNRVDGALAGEIMLCRTSPSGLPS